MSGKATGWVLDNGPTPHHLGNDGVRYGTNKARRMRAVLITIADAANIHGYHAHPGQKDMVEGSLYGRSAVLATIKELVADGWISVEEQGGGRGRATVYRVHMDRDTVQTADGSAMDTARNNEETARSAEETARSQCADQRERAHNGTTNGFSNNSSQSEGRSDATKAKVNGKRAQELLKAYIDDCDAKGRPRPSRPGMSASSICALLDAGHPERTVKWALVKAPTHTIPAMELAIRKMEQEQTDAESHLLPTYKDEATNG